MWRYEVVEVVGLTAERWDLLVIVMCVVLFCLGLLVAVKL